MPTAVETVRVERAAIIDAIALIYATKSLLEALNGREDSEVVYRFDAAEAALHTAAFGEYDDKGTNAWVNDPDVIDEYAQGSEVSAELLELAANDTEATFAETLQVALWPSSAKELADAYRVSAREMQEKRTIDVPFGLPAVA